MSCKTAQRKERGCGLGNGGSAVAEVSFLAGKYTKHVGSGRSHQEIKKYKYELTECPVSVMQRHRVAFSVAALWAEYERSPLDPKRCGLSLWSSVARLRSEANWAANKV